MGLLRPCLLLLGVLLPLSSFAQSAPGQASTGSTRESPPPPRQASLFDQLDRNRDGHLSREELASEAAKAGNWISVDRNGDGRIDRSEFGLVNATAAPPVARRAE